VSTASVAPSSAALGRATADRCPGVCCAGKIEPFLDHSITRFYLDTIPDQQGKIIAEYVWIGGTGQDMRSKSRTLSKMPEKPEDLPHWNYDGSSTGQAPGTDSEVYLIPRAIFRCAAALLLLCCCPGAAAAAAATGQGRH
jgi:hypothetical protein